MSSWFSSDQVAKYDLGARDLASALELEPDACSRGVRPEALAQLGQRQLRDLDAVHGHNAIPRQEARLLGGTARDYVDRSDERRVGKACVGQCRYRVLADQ